MNKLEKIVLDKLYKEDCFKCKDKEWDKGDWKNWKIFRIGLSERFKIFLRELLREKIKSVNGNYKGFEDSGELEVIIRFESGKKLEISHFGRGYGVELVK